MRKKVSRKADFFVYYPFRWVKYCRKGGEEMKKQDEKKPIPWEMADPKPPVIQSGHMENRREYDVR